jgi:hypothetical protein
LKFVKAIYRPGRNLVANPNCPIVPIPSVTALAVASALSPSSAARLWKTTVEESIAILAAKAAVVAALLLLAKF